jgi:hypothetical protein
MILHQPACPGWMVSLQKLAAEAVQPAYDELVRQLPLHSDGRRPLVVAARLAIGRRQRPAETLTCGRRTIRFLLGLTVSSTASAVALSGNLDRPVSPLLTTRVHQVTPKTHTGSRRASAVAALPMIRLPTS